ncbi:hypothetical protein P3X46_032565 [Hevea brasiliensis]|uniref:RNase H type-1 domain-containing protein n=1 Tax=Hevea brasiliensis TaxID=3981 RepID=A0ABQ9KEU5_HEVBR|nr:uncharacterized protein LOC131175863 [Hevea brasiliensis]KAJ9135374.1 hypothetical protein P3X46_032565 [Hevea brasiliensis]
MADYCSELLQVLSTHEDDKKLSQLLVYLFWFIWKARNGLVFEQQSWTFQEINAKAELALNEFLVSNLDDSPFPNNPIVRPPHWLPPPLSAIKINFDASVDINRNMGSLAAIVCNVSGKILGWFCKRPKGITDPTMLEAMACREAILLAKNKGLPNVVIEGDAKAIISYANVSAVPLVLQGIFHDTALLSSSFSPVSFTFASRKCNCVS